MNWRNGRKDSGQNKEFLFLTEDEIKDLMSFIASDYPELLGIVFFGVYYGLRRSEILGLKWDAIDYDKKLISIQHTVVRIKSLYSSDNTKTKESRRKLSLFPTAEKCLEKIRKQQEADRNFYKSSYLNTDGYIFCRPEITLHKLRHTCASILIDRGWDIKKVQYWLGHEDIKTTLDIYAHYIRSKSNEEGNDMEILSSEVSDLFA